MDFEKLGAFYLGKLYDPATGGLAEAPLLYDARDLTTHAVCVGMTGSGKTGLCISLLEEAAIDRVPALIIDPKGDITNLLLTFPELRGEDFRPWINVDDARRADLSEEEFAEQQAQLWREGLARWGQDGARIQMLREAADFVIYTPGSDAGVPISILQSFAAPELSWDTEAETLRERIQGIVSALLGLVGMDADPVRSREHILLANLLEHFWRQGQSLTLPELILAIQKPPLTKLGVFDVETFYPEKERFGLVMALNNIIAAPAFQSWLEGPPLDIAALLATPEGKPRHAIFYIAHLSDAERMFFVTLLLNHLIGWMRAQPGTTSLRALLYMDEVFGFFPPVAAPPSKKPLLTLLKQARAFGVGVLLATQNPADLDYKGLTNAGTWFIGRLQTERDQERLLTGLESAGASGAALGKLLSGLAKRVFLLHNVHEPAPVVFQTRWALSYLRGPLTRSQVRELMSARAATAPAAASPSPAPTPEPLPTPPASQSTHANHPPVLPLGVEQVYLPVRQPAAAAVAALSAQVGGPVTVTSQQVLYVAALLGLGRVHFAKQTKTLQVDTVASFAWLTQPAPGMGSLLWEQARALELSPAEVLSAPEPGAGFDALPETLLTAKALTGYSRDFADALYRRQSLKLWYSPAASLYSQPGETQVAFRARLNLAAREKRDAEVDALEARHAAKLKTLEERLRRARAALERKQVDAQARKQDAWLTAGETVLGLFAGRKRSLSTAARRISTTSKAKIDVSAAEESVEVVEADIQAVRETLKQESDAIVARWEAALETLEEVQITPRRTDVEVLRCGLAWTPYWLLTYEFGGVTQTVTLPAYENPAP